ncbi:hypothetical protein [Streptomyces sp. 891-h]|uniref:hypothetical protein n=1 Tax=Streptomyces sp. 891-h TaxID=2720714 RepID=UPI001FAA35ED|nr:hypothetical protein [Streptomyces sp. 891-h]UNZ18879.1 hypothetical protein HC362_19355 [Streptomyces sp. 891-h]
MAATAPLTLPVRLTVGDHTVDAGELTLEPSEPLRPAVAGFLRAAADILDDQEVTPDAAP